MLGVEPGPLTLRQLYWMIDAKRKHDWQLASTLIWITAEVNCDRKRKFGGIRRVPKRTGRLPGRAVLCDYVDWISHWISSIFSRNEYATLWSNGEVA